MNGNQILRNHKNSSFVFFFSSYCGLKVKKLETCGPIFIGFEASLRCVNKLKMGSSFFQFQTLMLHCHVCLQIVH